MKLSQRVLTVFAVTAILGTSAVTAHLVASPSVRAEDTVPDTLPLMFKNNSQRGEQLYIYVLGTSLATGRQGWADAQGHFHEWPAGGAEPTAAPDASIPGPAHGQALTLNLPKLSGRVYFSYGRKLQFGVTSGGLVQPAPQNPDDPNRETLFNWAEYTLNDSGLWINSTQVDMFSAPYAVGLKRADGTILKTGRLKPGGYRAFFNSLASRPGGWDKLIQTRSDGTVLRALSPGHAVTSGLLSPDVTDDYVNRVWEKFATSPLTVVPFAQQPDLTYVGRVSGDVMNFTDSSGRLVTSFEKPDADSIFNCHKQLDAQNDQVRGPISRTLCAGYNRGDLLDGVAEPAPLSSRSAQDESVNEYARILHEQMADGKAYAFAFDDVGTRESLVHDADPKKAYITLDPMN
ncbi:beta-1,3-glucanase family protein [Streptomyces sp. YS415]|uniref:beta-1,3-glucanase family protein n=1 Tax=Streptomyces sp. YS415 TaxID=2944806 RepID=UPI0020212557|nr:beta-1,3-glucanase family protein [Streptomyces sp. YS415]MCL7429369.1 beta-1,3-glucanase family protein [Streptomyces sp. YS415]